METVLAVRHSLSAPTCEKPMTRGLAAKADEVAKVVAEKASSMALARRVRRVNVILVSSFFWNTITAGCRMGGFL